MTTFSQAGRRRSVAFLAAIAAAALVPLAVAGPAQAQINFTVNDATDLPDASVGDAICATAAGTCTLRAAVEESLPGTEIILPKGLGPFRLTIPGGSEVDPAAGKPANNPNGAVGDLDVFPSITITGAGPSETVIDGMGSVRIFDVHAGAALNLNGVRLTNGHGDFDGATGHIHGGAIHNHGTVNVVNTVIDDSTVNVAPWGGGGITNAFNSKATLQNVTIAKNSSTTKGGGIENVGDLSLTNVTVAENSAPNGGGLFTTTGGTTTLTNTLVAESLAGGDCALDGSATMLSLGHNLGADGTCAFPQPTDLKALPGFEPARMGVPLFYPLQSSSPAVDAGDPQSCPATDIRGVARPQDGNGDGTAACDIGSYEREAATTNPPGKTPPPAHDPGTQDDPGQTTGHPRISVADVKLKEGDAGTKAFRFTVSLSAPATHAVTVRAQTADGTARDGSDYRGRTVTLTFDPGQTTKRVTVKVIGDTRTEPDETFKVKLSSPSRATIGDGRATGTIVNDD